MRRYKKFILTAVGMTFLVISVKAQNTNSPYSRYGYGVLSDRAIGASQAMGGISYGVRGLNTNPGNPASYAGIDSLTFIFDIGISYKNSKFSDGVNKQNDTNGGLDYVTMQFPIAKDFGMSIGLLPFSTVGYSFGSLENLDGVSNQKIFDGSGGFNQVYVGLGYNLMDNLSIGTNISYLFGNSSYYRSVTYPNITGANAEYYQNKLTMNGLKFDFGIQYELAIDKKNEIVLGAVFSPKYTHTGKIENIKNTINASGSVLKGDTVSYTGNAAQTELPNTIGVGFTWKRNKNIVVGADVTYQEWSKVKYSDNMNDDLTESTRFNDRWRFNAGIEYAIAPEERSFIKKMKFRGGLNYSNSYINVKTNNSAIGKYKEYGLTLGLGLPIKDGGYMGKTSYVNVNFEYNTLRPNLNGMVKENYFGISVNVNINELWFLKSKFR